MNHSDQKLSSPYVDSVKGTEASGSGQSSGGSGGQGSNGSISQNDINQIVLAQLSSLGECLDSMEKIMSKVCPRKQMWGGDTVGGLKFSGSCIRLCVTLFTKAILVPTVLISDWSPLTCVLNISHLIAAIFILNFNFEQPTPILFRFYYSIFNFL